MSSLGKYGSFIKFEHNLFSVPLLLAGALIAGKGWPSLRVIVLMLLAGVSGRVVALCFNRIIDREFDRLNPRTQNRHLASGEMSLLEAWIITGVGLVLFLLSAWLLSDVCLKLSWIPLLAFGAYPFFKRFTKWVHVGLGLVWSLVPLAGFIAVDPSLRGIGPALMLSTFCVFWLAGFDIIYSMLDEEFDRQAGLHSLPAVWGAERAMSVSKIFHGMAYLALLVLYGAWFSGPLTVMLLVVIGILLFLEQKFSRYVDLAFFQMNAIIGFVVLFFVVAGIKGV